MKLLDSLLDAIVRLEGDALVMHVGEKPYVITASSAMNAYRGPLAWGQVELSSRVLTFDAVSSMLAQILPPDQQRALDEFGAIEHEILPPDGILDRFTVVAARGGEDVWVEVRRKPVPPAVADVPAEAAPEPEAVAAESRPSDAIEPPNAGEQQIHVEPAHDAGPSVQMDDAAAENEAPETIVVALPGETREEVSLNAVPDNAIQIVDDEPQGVPTEEEVDAMLAATAAALLNSGLSLEDADADAAGATEIHAVEAAPEAAIVELLDESPIAAVEPQASEPEFELSPPPEIVATGEEEPSQSVESPEIPAGASLFTEEAVRAAEELQPETLQIDVIEITEVEERPASVASSPEPIAPEPEPIPELPEPIAEFAEPIPEPPRATIEEIPMAAPGARDMPAGQEAAASSPPPFVDQIPAEIPMDVTPETRQPEAIAQQHAETETRSGVVVPLVRSPIKTETISTPFTPAQDAALMHTLRIAAARGAGTVYVVAQSKPMIRVDGEILPLESEPMLTAADVDRLVMELAPPRRRDALQNGPVEWLCDVPEIGRVRCLTFRDHRGPGILFRMFPPRAISAEQLGLTPEVQALCQQSEGFVLVTGARASGKSTLLNAFVDLINRTRSDHVITIESQIGFVHESRRSFISQRETKGDGDLAAAVTRAALREDPDVMMIEELKSAELVSAALEAAESGRLVLASVPAASTIGALERLLEVLPADRRAKARTSLATSLRGIIAQVLLRRATGGRIAAREILLNTPAVSTLVLEGKMFQLPVALESGRRHGMVPLTDSLAGHVREGTVQAGEAYRKALDRAALVAALKRDGVDTSFAERLA